MSYNQTNKIHNPFEGEELEKGRFNLRPAEGDLKSAMKLVNQVVEDVQDSAKKMVEAKEEVISARNYLQSLELARHVAPKRSRQGDDKQIRQMTRTLERLAKQIDAYKLPYQTGVMDFNIPFVTVMSQIKEFNKER
jgi:chromosome segregation ATPase